MEITEEQRKRAEANRLAALAKRKAVTKQDPWKLFKCRKVSPEQTSSSSAHKPPTPTVSTKPKQLAEKFRVVVEICSHDSFCVTPLAIQGFRFPGEAACLHKLRDCLSNVVPSHYTQNNGGGKACVYNIRDHDAVLRCLKLFRGIEFEDIPWGTYNVIERLSNSSTEGRWIPCRPEHLPDEKVDELIKRLPKSLLDALLPFQHEGVRFGLRRGGRCLIADEMGLGKTIQAIAIAGCFMSEGSILVVCPAILRYSWAEEFERWLPSCLPSDIHLVFGHQSNPVHLTRCPRVVVISYTMLHRLRNSFSERDWAVLIVDESHHVRCTKKPSEPGEIKAVLDVATKVKHIVLLSGTPSLSRPYDIFHQINMLWGGLLGKDKYEFAKTYCSVKFVRGCQGKVFQDFSKGTRLEELNVLLTQTVMIRRLKENLLQQLPPKRRQIINLILKKSDIDLARAICKEVNNDSSANDGVEDGPSDISDEKEGNGASSRSSSKLSDQELGIAKLSGFREWLSIHPIIPEMDVEENIERSFSPHKMIIFAHHHKVLDRVQEFICEKEIEFVRIDGTTSARDRQLAIQSFQTSKEVKIAIIGILAGGSGLNLSSAQNVVFLELPKEPAHMLQAEDRAHRRGQTNAVNIYIFCAKDTSDESCWGRLNKRLRRVSSTMNGKYDAVQEIEVESVSYLETTGKPDSSENLIVERTSEEVSAFELVNSRADQDLLPDDGYARINEKANKRDEEHNDVGSYSSQKYFRAEAGDSSDLDLGKDKEGNSSQAKLETAGRVSSDYLVKCGEDVNQMEVNHKFPETTELNDGELVELIEADASNSIEVKSLRFEVSQYTGRIHLYSCIPGVDLRPRPLFENFRPEELELQHSPAEDTKNMAFKYIKEDPRYRHALVAFIKEWNSLRPIEQKKLFCKPLQLPLSVELCCLNESLNHDCGGLLKGGSKKRRTLLDEISHPLPSDAVWKKVCVGHGKKEREYEQGWTLTDEPLCKLCQTPCKRNNAKAPGFFEDLFCNLGCYEEYRLRTSNRSLREGLFQIEHGICSNCQLNCHKLVEHLRPLTHEKRKEYIKKVAPELAKRAKLLDKLVLDPTEGNAWHADHIVPVYRGGGECTLENMRTLCVTCHADVTAAQCAERRSTRVKAKKQLKAILRDVQNSDKVDSIQKECGKENIVGDEELIIEVPGSAYSGAKIISTESEEPEKSSNGGEAP